MFAAVEDLLEHRLCVSHRRTDHIEDFGGGFLLLQCFASFGNKPRVFHRDDRLRREVLGYRDLLVAERANFKTTDTKVAQQLATLAQRHHKTGSNAAKISSSTSQGR